MFKLISKILYSVIAIIEGFIVLRFILSAFNASLANPVVAFIINTSAYFVEPFGNVLPAPISIFGLTIESAVVVAFIVFFVAGLVAAELIKAFSGD